MIAVFGEALIDLVDGVAHGGGGPFNTSRSLARLGVQTSFVGRLSRDHYGQEIARLLRADGVDLSMASFGDEPTTTATAKVDSVGAATYSFAIEGTSAPNFTPAMLPNHLADAIRGIHVGTLGLVLQPVADTLLRVIERDSQGRMVMVDPNIRAVVPGVSGSTYRRRLDAVIRRSTIVKASQDDLAWLYPRLDYRDACQTLLDNDSVQLAIATLGREGAYGATRIDAIHVDSADANIIDTIGAGDAFGAAVLAWLADHDRLRPVLGLERSELVELLAFSCLVSAVTCERAGAEPPTRDEISRKVASYP